LRVAHEGAELIRASEHCELVLDPELSIVLFRRTGWTADDYASWSAQQLAEENAFVVPSAWNGETVLRYCVVNPVTTVDDLAAILDSLK
jgi:glutamate/tyrosine decarboxylase-like PLP-dependent enzyme